ncbi:MAG: hypothetical protein ABIR80_13465 [Opitutaceae bacterium]
MRSTILPGSPRVLRFRALDTRKNLPRASSAKRTESSFLSRFERAYHRQEVGREFAAGREFAIDGYGRADLLWLAWRRPAASDEFSALALKERVQLTAIEAKMKDWRKGLQQASRYRYFANRALLVLPPETARIARKYLATFRWLNVGLWAFDPALDRIVKHITPRLCHPLSGRAREKALQVIARHLNLC